MKKLLLSALALAALFLTACEEDALQNTVIDYTAPELEVSDESVDVASAPGATAVITVTTDQTVINADVDFSCRSWLSVSVSGTTVTVTAKEANPNAEARTGQIHVVVGEKGVTAEKWISVVQAKNALSLAKADVELGQASGSTTSIAINTELSGLTATVSSGAAAWLSAAIDGKNLVITTLSDNTAEEIRDAVVTVQSGSNTATVNVVQKGNLPTLELTPGDDIKYNTRWAGSKTEIAINTNKTPAASVSAGAESWLSAVIDGTTLTISIIATNEGTDAKVGTVTVTSGSLSKSVKVTLPGTPNLKYGTVYNNEGIIFWQNPDNANQYKVISAKAQKMNWSTVASQTGATSSDSDPATNNAAIKAMSDYATNGYVLKYCEDMGEGWYQPSVEELKALFMAYDGLSYDECTNATPDQITDPEKAARAAFESAMAAIGGQPINSAAETANGESIWSNRETSDGTKAYWVRFGKKGSDTGAKVATNPARYGRCVKVVTITD